MEYKALQVTIEDNIAFIHMNREERYNILSFTMLNELYHVFAHLLPENEQIRVAVLTGGKKCFSAGMNLKAVTTEENGKVARYGELTVAVYTKIMDYDGILLCAVDGIAMGGGFNLALMGDLIICSEAAIFSHPEIKMGLNPILTPMLSRIGLTRTKELALRGDPIGAQKAYDIGLINRVVGPDEFEAKTLEWARQLAKRPPEAVRMLKRSFDVVPRLNTKSALEYEIEMSALLISSNADVRGRMRKIIEKGKE